MTPERKREVIEWVRRAPVPKKQTLQQLGLSASTILLRNFGIRGTGSPRRLRVDGRWTSSL
jgi:hypothetical protein